MAGNYSAYLNKYDTRLYVYDSLGAPLYNDDPTTYDALNTIVTLQAIPPAPLIFIIMKLRLINSLTSPSG